MTIRFSTLLLVVPVLASAQGIPRGDAYTEGLDTTALRNLVEQARVTNSSSLVILKNGKLVFEWYGHPRERIEAMSATKSIVSMGLGHLIDQGKLELDQPVYTLFSEWKEGRRSQITVRHLMNHTSGLQADVTTEKIYASPDFVKHALTSEIIHQPGKVFFYNNSALNLLAGIAGRAAGEPLDQYLGRTLFAPLDITDFTWTKDNAGNPHGMSGLQIHAVDLAKLGQLMLNRGEWNGKQLLSREWVELSTKPGQPYNPTNGLLWWLVFDSIRVTIDQPLVAEWRKAGVSNEAISKITPLVGKVMTPGEFQPALIRLVGGERQMVEFQNSLARAGVMLLRYLPGRPIGYYASGYLGQYLVVIPEQRLVAVRQIRYDRHQGAAHNFVGFQNVVAKLSRN
jgi:CubicO group peptidase (beta-lactamase class C family)